MQIRIIVFSVFIFSIVGLQQVYADNQSRDAESLSGTAVKKLSELELARQRQAERQASLALNTPAKNENIVHSSTKKSPSVNAVSEKEDSPKEPAEATKVNIAEQQKVESAQKDSEPPTLEETRLTMDKWIETQQIISKERKDWQQGKEILQSRLELVKKEIAALEDKIKEAKSSVVESDKKRDELNGQNDEFKSAGDQLTKAVTQMESDVRRLFKQLPDPIQSKLQPLFQRIPENPEKTKVSTAERFQNVFGILNEVNKANSEITVNYEVHNLSDGKPAEVKAVYIGLGQAYYLGAGGEAGIGRPSPDGWKWEASNSGGRDISTALEILEGKQKPAFVPLAVKLQ